MNGDITNGNGNGALGLRDDPLDVGRREIRKHRRPRRLVRRIRRRMRGR